VVSGSGEHHNAADAVLDFLGDRDRIRSLRLHTHAETKKKAINFAGSDEIDIWHCCARRDDVFWDFAQPSLW
jgi:hypothetical protein